MARRSHPISRLLHWPLRILFAIVLVGVAAWVFGALFYGAHVLLAVAALAFMTAALALLRPRWKKNAVFFGIFAVVLLWWLLIPPRQDRDWQPEVAQTPYAEIDGDTVTLHNLRNFEYVTESDYTARWETRTVQLSKLVGLDFFLNYWGSPHIAHPILSFQFADAPPVCFSIETRKEKGESYSTLGGFFRLYELVYVMADERDVIRVRTSIRKGEDVYLYRLNASAADVRALFLDYLKTANSLHEKPEWYNALTDNCTTGVRIHVQATGRAKPWDWRLLANGHVDERIYDSGAMDATLAFSELKARSHINQRALATEGASDFSAQIRAGLPGFQAPRTAALSIHP